MGQREWATPPTPPPCENILTENVDIINGLCKEVEKLMHLLRGVGSVELSLLPSWIITALGFGLHSHTHTHTHTHTLTHTHTHTHTHIHTHFTQTHTKRLPINRALIKCLTVCVRVCVFWWDVAEGSKSVVLELSCCGGCGMYLCVCVCVCACRGGGPQIMMWFQHEAGWVYLATVHYDVRPPATEGAEWRWACHIDLFSAKIWATLLCSPAQWCEK